MARNMTPRLFPRLLVPKLDGHVVRRPIVVFLGLAGIILGILAMHVMGVSHQGLDTAGHGAASAQLAVSHDHSPTMMPAPGGADGHADGACSGPCNGEHHLMAVMCMLMVVVVSVLWFLPKRWFIIPGRGLRAPPALRLPELRLQWTPSLIELSISRT